MVSTRTTAAAVIAGAVGLLTLRTVRNRRVAEDDPDPADELRAEATEASDHATAAISHARAAAEHAIEYGRQEYDTRSAAETSEETEQTRLSAVGRFR